MRWGILLSQSSPLKVPKGKKKCCLYTENNFFYYIICLRKWILFNKWVGKLLSKLKLPVQYYGFLNMTRYSEIFNSTPQCIKNKSFPSFLGKDIRYNALLHFLIFMSFLFFKEDVASLRSLNISSVQEFFKIPWLGYFPDATQNSTLEYKKNILSIKLIGFNYGLKNLWIWSLCYMPATVQYAVIICYFPVRKAFFQGPKCFI